MMTLYGIPNCDTVKKARKWLEQNELAYRFHNYKTAGIDSATLENWCQTFGIDNLLNRRGTTWRQLDEADRQADLDQGKAIELMRTHTSLIKRPLLDTGKRKILGFDPKQYESLL